MHRISRRRCTDDFKARPTAPAESVGRARPPDNWTCPSRPWATGWTLRVPIARLGSPAVSRSAILRASWPGCGPRTPRSRWSVKS